MLKALADFFDKAFKAGAALPKEAREHAVEFAAVKRVRLEADDIVAYADGERIGALPVEVEAVPGALTVFA